MGVRNSAALLIPSATLNWVLWLVVGLKKQDLNVRCRGSPNNASYMNHTIAKYLKREIMQANRLKRVKTDCDVAAFSSYHYHTLLNSSI